MLETANLNGDTASRRGEAKSSASSTSVAGEKRSGEQTTSQSGSEDKASKKMKKDSSDTSGNISFFLNHCTCNIELKTQSSLSKTETLVTDTKCPSRRDVRLIEPNKGSKVRQGPTIRCQFYRGVR